MRENPCGSACGGYSSAAEEAGMKKQKKRSARREMAFNTGRRYQMRARTALLVTALTLASSGAGASVAAATPGPTPDYGLTGACNMTNPNAAFGMFTIAGSVANPNGFDVGMIIAILKTNGGTVPENCGG
jgi:hypothetical protein